MSPRSNRFLVQVVQLGHVCALLGIINVFVLHAVRKELRNQPALQEKILGSLLYPLLMGDILHVYVTLWALGEDRWDITSWCFTLWTTLGLGLTLMIPRLLYVVIYIN
jgi:hypothetical protein